MKNISTHAAAIYPRRHPKDWASDLMIAAEVDRGIDFERIASIQTRLPAGIKNPT